VFDNLAFPLRNLGLDRNTIAERVTGVAELLGIRSHLSQKPATLSASIRQLVSLGRGLVRTNVNAILFDEPLTVIDPQEKWHLRTQLKKLHREFQLTMIYVTHDQTEALTFADTVMVMHDGCILQSASPGELFDRPRHKFVGQFIGSPGMNFVPCEVDGDNAKVAGGFMPLSSFNETNIDADNCELGFRPEYCHFSRDGSGIPAQLVSVERTSRRKIAHLSMDGNDIRVSLPIDQEIPADDHHVCVDPQHALLYSAELLVETRS